MKKVVAFGEILLGLSPPGHLRFMQAHEFVMDFAGAEANACVALSLNGVETEFVTRLPDHAIARRALAALHQYQVGTRHVVLGGERLGLYYLERGASQRPSRLIYDRKDSAISLAKPDAFDWDAIMKAADVFLFTGITPALGEHLPAICRDACQAAHKAGATVFCDLNYRKALWSAERAQHVMKTLVRDVDVLVGNEEDAQLALGADAGETDVVGGRLDYGQYSRMARRLTEEYGFKSVALTLRSSLSASDNDWAGMLFREGNACFSRSYRIHVVDRVGSGDSFTSGLIYALLHGYDAQKSVEYATAASCLKQTTELNFNLSNASEIEQLMNGDGSGRIQR
jgi:2-dehydro-3-deoxygluconokinase